MRLSVSERLPRILQKLMCKGNTGLSRFRKILTAAPGPLPTMHQNALHAATYKGEGKVSVKISPYRGRGIPAFHALGRLRFIHLKWRNKLYDFSLRSYTLL